MTIPPYPLVPQPMKKSWLERNAQWKIPLGCLTLIFVIGTFGAVVLTLITTSFRHSDVYKEATARATNNALVRDLLGEPIKPAWLMTGQMNTNGSTGHADLSIPITGPRGKAVIRAVADKNHVWRFTYLAVTVEGRPEIIDLLSVQPLPEREF
jgi:hypothetical protein